MVDNSGVITTVAGNGVQGFSGDGGPATSAQLNGAGGLTLDRSGNLFIADTANHRVRKVDTSGVITTVAGTGAAGSSGDGGPATGALLNSPRAVAFDAADNLVISDGGNSRIRKVDASGIITTFAGTGVPGNGGDGGPAISARLAGPQGIAFDGAGNLFIAESSAHRIRKVDASGIISTVVGQTTTSGFSGDGGPAISAQLFVPIDVAIDGTDNLFIADLLNSRIRKVDTSGVITTIAGNGGNGFNGDGGPATSAELVPIGITFDDTGNLFIADTNNDRIRKVESIGGTHGDLVWAKAMGGASNQQGNAIAVDASGNVYTTGSFQGTADFDPGAGTANLVSAGGNDIFVQKLNSAGNLVWVKGMGGTDEDLSKAIVVDAWDNVYTTGFFNGTMDFDPGAGTAYLTSVGGNDIFVSKLDSAGNFLWAKAMGGTGFLDVGTGIAVDASGNTYIVGRFRGTVDFDPGAGTFDLTGAGSDDIFVSKLNSAGDFVWAKTMGGMSVDIGLDLAIDASGNLYMTGHFQGTADFDPGPGTFNLTSIGHNEIFVSVLNSDGNFVWAKSMGGTGSDIGQAIAVDASGNVYTTGTFNDTADFDPGPATFNLTSAGNRDIFVQKLDAAGNFLWAKAMGGTDNQISRDIAVDTLGNVYTTGWFNSTVDFDPGPATFNLTSVVQSDIFVQKLNAAGSLVWAMAMGSATAGDAGSGIALGALGDVYVTGSFKDTADFDPGPGAFNLTSVDGADIFVLKLHPESGTSIEVAPLTLDFGSVDAFTTLNMIVTIANTGTSDLTVSEVSLSGDLAYSASLSTPDPVIAPGGSIDVTVSFFPTSATAFLVGTLLVVSDDAAQPSVEVSLLGNGIEGAVDDQATVLEEAVDTVIDSGGLVGSGSGGSGSGRLEAFANMIEAAGDLIEAGLIEEACGQLASALKRVDGNPRPPDFVTGLEAELIRDHIVFLRASLGCK